MSHLPCVTAAVTLPALDRKGAACSASAMSQEISPAHYSLSIRCNGHCVLSYRGKIYFPELVADVLETDTPSDSGLVAAVRIARGALRDRLKAGAPDNDLQIIETGARFVT